MLLTDIKLNPNNPRSIKTEKFKKLVKSIKESTKFLEARPIVVKDGVVYAGNMRTRALLELGYTEVPDEWVKDVSGWTAQDIHKFIVVDNVAYGDNDWDLLSEQYEKEELEEWRENRGVAMMDRILTKNRGTEGLEILCRVCNALDFLERKNPQSAKNYKISYAKFIGKEEEWEILTSKIN